MSEAGAPVTERPAATATTAAAAADRAPERRRRVRQRYLAVQGLRLLAAVVWIGSWEVSTRQHWVDPFFFGLPSGVVGRLSTWVPGGTAPVPPSRQVGVPM